MPILSLTRAACPAHLIARIGLAIKNLDKHHLGKWPILMTVKVTWPHTLRLITGFLQGSACVPVRSSSVEVVKVGNSPVPQQVDCSSLGRTWTELSERRAIYHVMKGAHTAFVKHLNTNYDIWYVRSHSLLQ
jgi:hypothetical protein